MGLGLGLGSGLAEELRVQALRESGSSHKREAALTALERLVACSG